MSNILAVILAGGQGERLSILSEKRAKPAVPFAGKYRIIDFALSNCVNSGIYDVVVLTQYRPHSLQDHIGIGDPWDLNRRHGGVRLLQPFVGRHEADWYSGTADAVFQNLAFILESTWDYVLILAGDHIYRMDYRPMIAYHQQHGADVTLGGIVVPREEAHRFGILETDASGRVVDFEEKPANPRGTLGSMGIYVFSRDTLPRVLLEDERGAGDGEVPSQHDFGRNIIPGMVERGERVFAYPFTGYWQDVGTVQSYWEAHMGLLDDRPAFDLFDPSWVVHTRSEERPPARVFGHATITRSLVSHGCLIQGQVERSVLSPGVAVEAGAVVRDSILLFDVVVGSGSVVDHAILDKQVRVGREAQVGYGDDLTPNRREPGKLNTGITLIGKRTQLPDGMRVGRNCLIGADLRPEDFTTDALASGETLEHSTASHLWELELARRRLTVP